MRGFRPLESSARRFLTAGGGSGRTRTEPPHFDVEVVVAALLKADVGDAEEGERLRLGGGVERRREGAEAPAAAEGHRQEELIGEVLAGKDASGIPPEELLAGVASHVLCVESTIAEGDDILGKLSILAAMF